MEYGFTLAQKNDAIETLSSLEENFDTLGLVALNPGAKLSAFNVVIGAEDTELSQLGAIWNFVVNRVIQVEKLIRDKSKDDDGNLITSDSDVSGVWHAARSIMRERITSELGRAPGVKGRKAIPVSEKLANLAKLIVRAKA